jgi:glycosyltransferase involved in cell wall biosynthesis
VSSRHRVAIVQEAVLHYRERFYELLRERLAAVGIDLVLVHSNDEDDVFESAIDLPWAHHVPARRLRLGGRDVVYQPCRHALRGCELVIVEQGTRHLINYALFAEQALGRRKVALWGHGRNFDAANASRLGESLKASISRHAHWWFAYTDASAAIVAELGMPTDRITSVQNAVDTHELRDQVAALTSDDADRTRADLGLTGRSVGLYLGSLHPVKRLGYVFEASEAIRSELPDFELVVAGAGTEEADVQRFAHDRPWVHPVGAVRGAEKAALLQVADVALMPSWAGLAVLDSFAGQTPMAISGAFSHAPEAAYLEDGVNGLVVEDGGEPRRYGGAVAGLLTSPERLEKLRAGCAEAVDRYSVEQMVERFAVGIEGALARPASRRDA